MKSSLNKFLLISALVAMIIVSGCAASGNATGTAKRVKSNCGCPHF